MNGDCETFNVMISTLVQGTIGSVAFMLAATLCHGNPRKTNVGILYHLGNICEGTCNVGELIYENGKFTMGKLKTFPLSLCCVVKSICSINHLSRK
jgi:hypothetical protein